MEQQTASEQAVLTLEEKDKLITVDTTISDEGRPILGHTLVDILYKTVADVTNPRMFNQKHEGEWRSLSLSHFKTCIEELAVGMVSIGLEQGDRVALYMESDTNFCIADMGCLLAGLVDVPIYLKQSPGTNEFILQHSGARALFVSSLSRLQDIDELLAEAPDIRTVIVAEPEADQKLTPLPEGVQWISMDRLRRTGRQIIEEESGKINSLRDRINAQDIATIVYTSGTTGEPKGAMLTHENLSFNALTAFAELERARGGPQEDVAISFLPLTHIFARTLHYATLAYGISIYFTTPESLGEDLKEVRPTIFASVPRLLEKVYGRILEKVTQMSGIQKKLANWSLVVAQKYTVGQKQGILQGTQHRLANTLVFRKWRAALGGRVKIIIAGGAAVSSELVNVFGAAGISILQGYGLTETSPVISFNRPNRNRPGTVGEMLPGVEVKIAKDGEILTRGPHIMKGYYKNPAKTKEVLIEGGWFCTGDIGELSDDGYLRITDRKKDLFKLSTGKYVMPQPLENRLTSHPLIEQAVVVGPGRKYCCVLLFIDKGTLRIFGSSIGLNKDIPLGRLIEHPKILDKYQTLVDVANEGMDHWSTIKHFALMLDQLTIENGLLTPTMKIKRKKICDKYKPQIDVMYEIIR